MGAERKAKHVALREVETFFIEPVHKLQQTSRKLVKVRHQFKVIWVDRKVRVVHQHDAATAEFCEIADEVLHPFRVPALQPPVHNQCKVTFWVATTICQAFVERCVELRLPCTEEARLSTFSSESNIKLTLETPKK